MVPRVAAVRIESSWESQDTVRCVARLTRALTAEEAKRVQAIAGFEVETDRVFYDCRPEEIEAREKHLGAALERAARRKSPRSRISRILPFHLPP